MRTLTRTFLAALAATTLATTALAQAGAVVTPPREVVAGTGVTLNPQANAAPANASTGAQTVNPAATTGAVTANPATGAVTANPAANTGAVTANPAANTGAVTANPTTGPSTATATNSLTVNNPPAVVVPACPSGKTCITTDAANQVEVNPPHGRVVPQPQAQQQLVPQSRAQTSEGPRVRHNNRSYTQRQTRKVKRYAHGCPSQGCRTTWNVSGNVNVYHGKHRWW